MSNPTLPPTPDPVEDRLRATLAAEADRHPITPDFDGLQARADRAVIDLTVSPRRTRARIVALAAALALVAGAVGAVALRSADDDGEPVIADEPPPTGYYLPGEGWEITEVYAFPLPSLPGTARVVELSEPETQEPTVEDEVFDSRSATIFVSQLDAPDPDLVTLAEEAGWSDPRTVTRGEGDSAREYVIAPLSDVWGDDAETEVVDPRTIESDGGSLLASVDDLLLSIDFYGPLGEQAVLELADRWWESGGEAISIDPAAGLTRVSDVTYPDVEPTSVEDLLIVASLDDSIDIEEIYADATLQVVVEVASPEGWTGSYSLVPADRLRPTGAGDPEAARAAGFAADEVGAPLPAEVGGPQPAWETPTGITADVPGGSLGVGTASFIPDEMDAEQSRALWSALQPASLAAWTETTGAIEEPAVPDGVWGRTLATTDATAFLDDHEVEEGSTSFSGEGEVIPGGDAPIEVLPRDGTNPAAGATPEEVEPLVADAVLAFVGGPGPVDADLFAPTVEFVDGDGSAPITAAIEDVAAVTFRDGEITPAFEARGVLDVVSPAHMTELVGADDGCAEVAEIAAEPDAVVLIRDDSAALGEEPCHEWEALVVTLDAEQRITRIETRQRVIR